MIDAYVLPIMFKENATNLNNISVDKGIEWLQSFDTILSDCDGKWTITNKNSNNNNQIFLLLKIESMLGDMNNIRELKITRNETPTSKTLYNSRQTYVVH